MDSTPLLSDFETQIRYYQVQINNQDVLEINTCLNLIMVQKVSCTLHKVS